MTVRKLSNLSDRNFLNCSKNCPKGAGLSTLHMLIFRQSQFCRYVQKLFGYNNLDFDLHHTVCLRGREGLIKSFCYSLVELNCDPSRANQILGLGLPVPCRQCNWNLKTRWRQCGLQSGKCHASRLLFSEPVKWQTRWPKQLLTSSNKSEVFRPELQ